MKEPLYERGDHVVYKGQPARVLSVSLRAGLVHVALVTSGERHWVEERELQFDWEKQP